ncbi:hypothetical protein XELAEV_18000366mg [Xenopus laevis]|uniref:C3H1-type domain-containing protein n=1 Tax=Xenopus laevis TaxID=8355 RepID=A0A974GZD9_XENLA|nr:hypothetical protein XELAEV_18000366mg [Xenopus laevis]
MASQRSQVTQQNEYGGQADNFAEAANGPRSINTAAVPSWLGGPEAWFSGWPITSLGLGGEGGSRRGALGVSSRGGVDDAAVASAGKDPAPGEKGEVEKRESEREVLRGIMETARQNAYVAFAGPLGVYVKWEVKEKIWKVEFMELFSLLPLDETIELKEEDKKDSKKEEEDIIGEKHPEKCSPLFCYVDGAWEAFKVYDSLTWWRYGEHFRQQLAANPTMRWKPDGHYPLAQTHDGPEGIPLSEGGRGLQHATCSAPIKQGYCWLFNDSHCKFGNSCKYKHEFSGCGVAHSYVRCFKKGKGGGRGLDAEGDGRLIPQLRFNAHPKLSLAP